MLLSAGALDATFDFDGIVTTDFSNHSVANGIAIQGDGKIVSAGSIQLSYSDHDFALARYNPDGSLDAGFGSGGMLTTSFGGNTDIASDVVLQSDGRIVLGGWTDVGKSGPFAEFDRAFALARYNPDGSLDTSFGSGRGQMKGKVVTELVDGNRDERINALALQDDGKIVAVGVANGNIAVARYEQDGSLDASFGNSGIVITDLGSSQDDGMDVVIQDGMIVVAGSFDIDPSPSSYVAGAAIVRYGPEGSLDSSFDGDGIVTSNRHNAKALALQGVDKIVVAGDAWNPEGTTSYAQTVVACYDQDGSLDTSFGTDGIAVAPPEFNGSYPNDVADVTAAPDSGRILVGGSAQKPTSADPNGPWDWDFSILRFNSDGSLDTDFDIDGIAITPVDPQLNDSVHAIAIQADGAIVAAGSSPSDVRNGNDFTLVRYLGDPRPNRPPVANDDSASTDIDTPITIDVLANDSDPDGDSLSVVVPDPTTAYGGSVTSDGMSVTYTPQSGFTDTDTDTFTYTISDGNGGTDTATVTVQVNGTQPTTFSIDSVSKREGRTGKETTFTFTVTRTGDISQAASISYATGDGTAHVADNDYVATSGWLTFAEGETTKTISVTVNGDITLEEDEFFFLRLSLTGEDLTEIATGTIINDDK